MREPIRTVRVPGYSDRELATTVFPISSIALSQNETSRALPAFVYSAFAVVRGAFARLTAGQAFWGEKPQ